MQSSTSQQSPGTHCSSQQISLPSHSGSQVNASVPKLQQASHGSQRESSPQGSAQTPLMQVRSVQQAADSHSAPSCPQVTAGSQMPLTQFRLQQVPLAVQQESSSPPWLPVGATDPSGQLSCEMLGLHEHSSLAPQIRFPAQSESSWQGSPATWAPA